MSNAKVDEPVIKQVLNRYVMIHKGTFLFCLLILLISMAVYIMYIRLSSNIVPDKCEGIEQDRDAKHIQKAIYGFSIAGIILNTFLIVFFLLHYFMPLF